jgi:hypothetical protein
VTLTGFLSTSLSVLIENLDLLSFLNTTYLTRFRTAKNNSLK